ncbi:hypothetical protein [Streptomyces sp. NPDC006638]|uniref:hypothetical protein n=1 Tax=unclassified Streptomyces TaxID=2593676 RepID=UPI00339FB360
MNVRRILTTAAAGSALLAAVAPAAQAAQSADFGTTLSSAAQTAATVGEKTKPVADGLLGKKIGAAKGVLKGGSDVVKHGQALLG